MVKAGVPNNKLIINQIGKVEVAVLREKQIRKALAIILKLFTNYD